MALKLSEFSTYTKHATTILFIVGFLFDIVLLPDISERLSQYIGLLYLFGIGALILFREWVVSRNTASTFEQRLYSLVTFGIAYLSGSALSFVLVYTLRGSALSVSWPLLVILFLCSIANEVVSSHKYRFTLDIAVFFIAVLFYTIFNVPVFLKMQNDSIFLVSTAASVIFGLLYVTLLKSSSEVASYEAPRGYALALGVPMFFGMLYVLNIIPAVPLSLSSSGVYHSVTKYDDGSFLGTQEIVKKSIFSYFKTPVYHLTTTDDGVYVYASVKAPAEVTAPISHVWQHYDETTKTWIDSTKISYTSQGGRESGYRAYSHKANITDGLWRVTIQVGNNRIVGRITFRVTTTSGAVQLKSVSL